VVGTADATRTVERLQGLLAVAQLVRAGVRGQELLVAVAQTVSREFGFRSVVVNLYRRHEDDFEVVTVCGSDKARRALLGTTSGFEAWSPLLNERFEVSGAYFVPTGAIDWSDRDLVSYIPDIAPLEGRRAWQPEDALLVPLRRSDGRLIGVLSMADRIAVGLRARGVARGSRSVDQSRASGGPRRRDGARGAIENDR
jgi:hypothetical protein